MSEIIRDIAVLDIDTDGAGDSIDRYVRKLENLENELDQTKKGSAEYDRVLNQIKATTKELSKVTDLEAKSIQGKKTKIEALQQAQKRLNQNSKEFIKIEEEIQKEIKGLVKEYGRLEKSAKSVEGLEAKVKSLQTAQSKLNKESKEWLALEIQIQKESKNLSKLYESQEGSVQSLSDSILGGVGNFKNLIFAGVGVGVVGEAISRITELTTILDARVNSVQLKFKKLGEEDAGNLTADIVGTAAEFELEFDNVLKSLGSATKEFGESQATALSGITLGLLNATSQEAKEELLTQLNEYSSQFAKFGASLGQSIAIITKGDELGIYADKAADVIKETGERLTLQDKVVVEAVQDILGKGFSDELFEDINNKIISPFEGFQRIAEKVGEVDLNPAQYTQLIDAVGGTPLLDAGENFLKAIVDIGDGTEILTANLTDYQKAQLKTLKLQKEAARQQVEISKELKDLANGYNDLSLTIKVELLKAIVLLIKGLKELPKILEENKAIIVTYAALLTVLKLRQVGVTASTIATTAAYVIHAAKAKLASLGTLNLSKAVKLLGAAFRATPFGVVATALTAITAAFILLRKRTDDQKEAQERLNTATKAVTAQYIQEKAELDKLFKPLLDDTAKREEKAAAIDVLNEKFPELLENFDIEKASQEDLIRLYDLANERILANIVAKQRSAAQQEILNKIIEKEGELIKIQNEGFGGTITRADKLNGVLTTLGKRFRGQDIDIYAETTGKATGRLNKELDKLKQELSQSDADFQQIFDNLKDRLAGIDLSSLAAPGGSSTKPRGGKKSALATTVEEAEATENSLAQLKAELQELEKILSQTDVSDIPALQSVIDKIDEVKEDILEAEILLDRLRNGKPGQLEGIEPIDVSGSKDAVSNVVDEINAEDYRVEIEADVDGDALKEKVKQIFEGVQQVAGAITNFIGQQFDFQVQEAEASVNKQQAIFDALLDNQETSNAEQVRLEQERLAALEEERAKAVKKQQALAQLEVVANSLVAISKAAAQGGIAAPFTIAATLIALIAGFAKARQAGGQALFDGTEYLERGHHKPGRDTIPAMLNEGEAVIPTENNKKYHPVVKAIMRKSVPANVLNDFVEQYPVQDYSLTRAANKAGVNILDVRPGGDMKSTEKLLKKVIVGLEELPSKMPSTSIKMDKKGFSASILGYLNKQAKTANKHK